MFSPKGEKFKPIPEMEVYGQPMDEEEFLDKWAISPEEQASLVEQIEWTIDADYVSDIMNAQELITAQLIVVDKSYYGKSGYTIGYSVMYIIKIMCMH